MISNLFKPRWQHDDVTIRREAVAQMQGVDNDQQQILQEIATNDTDAGIRQLAISKLDSHTTLEQLLRAQKQLADSPALLERLKALIVTGSIDDSTCMRLLREFPALLNHTLFSSARSEPLLLNALSLVTEPSRLVDIATHAKISKVRVQAATEITDETLLQELMRARKGHDNGVYQVCKDKLRAIRETEERIAHHHAHSTHVCEQLEKLARIAWEPLYEGRLEHLTQQWRQQISTSDAVLQPAADLQQRATQALERCREFIVAHHAALQSVVEIAAPEVEATPAIEEEPAPPVVETPEEIAEKLAALAKQQEEQAKQKAEQEKQQQLCATLQQQLAELDKSITEGLLQESQRAYRTAQDQLAKIDGKRRNALEQQLHALQARLHELESWRNFASQPKMEELCNAMQKLADTPLPPTEKAEAVRALQQQWKLLGGSHTPKQQRLWSRFNEASERAWEPCKVYFDNEKKLRDFNLQQREVICQELEHYAQHANWEKPDWKFVFKLVEKARSEYQKFSPIDRKAQTAIQQRFDTAMKPIVGKLHGEQEANEARKQQLIDRAAAMAAGEAADNLVTKIKEMQEQWKQIGITRYKKDQQLWQAFRVQCDAVFNKRKEKVVADRGVEEANRQQALEIIAAIEKLAKLPDDELAGTSARFTELETQFRNLGAFPKKNYNELRQAYQQASERYRTTVNGLSGRKKKQQQSLLADRAALCSELEALAFSASVDNNAVEDLLMRWESAAAVPANNPLMAGIEARWQQALAAVRGEKAVDVDACNRARRLLMIRMEIEKGVESPESERALRMEYQLQQLQRKMGQGANKQDWATLQQEWLTTPAAAKDIMAALEVRYAKLQGR